MCGVCVVCVVYVLCVCCVCVVCVWCGVRCMCALYVGVYGGAQNVCTYFLIHDCMYKCRLLLFHSLTSWSAVHFCAYTWLLSFFLLGVGLRGMHCTCFSCVCLYFKGYWMLTTCTSHAFSMDWGCSMYVDHVWESLWFCRVCVIWDGSWQLRAIVSNIT